MLKLSEAFVLYMHKLYNTSLASQALNPTDVLMQLLCKQKLLYRIAGACNKMIQINYPPFFSLSKTTMSLDVNRNYYGVVLYFSFVPSEAIYLFESIPLHFTPLRPEGRLICTCHQKLLAGYMNTVVGYMNTAYS
ncbi:hypothetical protein NC653_027863 [Populus alba x Populus x berolinensis]|uniref:Uncharacterized protein n=1 Tax=Populus alba x Populus x berolinensis TaxID=444605 RepID=A0AAD6Q5J8_9ROSI|nr:hypothetical protein NC653_027863 [Populus alba x Populus x berolinensis]